MQIALNVMHRDRKLETTGDGLGSDYMLAVKYR